MSIAAQCPHCETRFNLQPDMNGKSMRCPNLECRQVFTVQAMQAQGPAADPPPPPPPPPPSKYVAKKATSAPTKPKATPKQAQADDEVVDAVIVDAAVVSKPKVKEVVWTEGTDVPPKKGKPVKAEAEDEFVVRRKKKSSRGPLVLLTLAVLSGAIVIFAVAYIFYYQGKNEEKLAKQAKEQYEKGEYNDAAKNFEKLTKEYPDSKKVDEYKFFYDLSSMQIVVRSVTNRENYEPAVKKLREFIEANKDSPFAKPTTGFGRDILEAGKKLGEDIAAHAGDRVKAYKDDRATKGGELNRADKAIADGRELLPVLDPFRAADDLPLTKLKDSFDAAEKAVKHERDRTAALTAARAKLESPTDAVIQGVIADLQTAGFLEDPEAQAMIAAAKGKLRDLVQWEDDPAARQGPPPTAAASLLFVSPIGKTAFREPVAGEPPPTVYLCVARGILYALEDDTGALLWAARVGPDVTDPPAVARVELDTGLTDVAVVTSNVGGAPALAGHNLRTGAVMWYQPLTGRGADGEPVPAPAAGPAIVVGSRAFVPLRDAAGSVVEFDLKTGGRVGRIRLGQTVADRAATIRPGTNLLYVAADARRLYVLDVSGKDDNGNRVNPRCLQVIATGHLPGTLRVAPLFVGPEGTEPAERWMVLAQADGTGRTQLRAFPVEGIPAPPAEGMTLPETPAVSAVSLPIPGWVTYAPVSDGERLAVITDTGHFRLFGVKQAGNSDKALFPLPSAAPPPGANPVPGLVIPLEESTYWLLVGGQLQKARLALVPSKGQEIVLSGQPRTLGEPVHRAQVNTRKDVACVVVRTLNSSGCRAVAFDLRDGGIRWQRQLGLVPAKMSADQFAAPVAQGDRFILVDEDGGIVAVPAASKVGAGQTLAAPPEWGLASPPLNATGPTLVVASPGGKTVYTVTPVAREGGPKFVVRRVVDGKIASDDEVNAPGALAGQPAVVGEGLMIPTADGFVNRFTPGNGLGRNGSLVAGPAWRERNVPTAACSITALSDSTFATSDGGKKLSRWDWPATPNGKWTPAGAWELSQNFAGPGVVLPPSEPNGSPRLIVADVSGSVWLFAANRVGEHLRRWQPGSTLIPPGKPSSNFAVQSVDAARTVVTYVVDGKVVVAISPERENALWATPRRDDANSTVVGTPQPAGENRWLVTDLAGRVLVFSGETGDVQAAQTVGLPGAVPASASGIASDKALTPLSDGSAVVIELPKPAPTPPKKE